MFSMVSVSRTTDYSFRNREVSILETGEQNLCKGFAKIGL